MSSTRNGPLAELVQTTADEVGIALSYSAALVKRGAKGPVLLEWAERNRIVVPGALYETLPVGKDGVMARVGADELIIECEARDPLLPHFDAALETATTGVYRIEQQSVTLVLSGDTALGVLAQTCGVDFAVEPAERMVYTRVAGVSCGILPSVREGQRVFRLWVDYSLAPYMWETLAQIVSELISAKTSG